MRLPPQHLQRLDDFLRKATDEHGYLGAVALIAQRGDIVALRATGYRDLSRRTPMGTDAIFRIYSMTKTIVTVAALQLVEEGRLALDAPVEKILPAFAAPRVLIGGGADAPQRRGRSRCATCSRIRLDSRTVPIRHSRRRNCCVAPIWIAPRASTTTSRASRACRWRAIQACASLTTAQDSKLPRA